MGWFFKIFLYLSQNWLKFKKILEKLGDFAQNFAKKLGQLVYEWVTFSWKIGISWVFFQICGGSTSLPKLNLCTPRDLYNHKCDTLQHDKEQVAQAYFELDN